MKTVDFRKTVKDLCTEDPEIIEIMKDLGFDNIVKPGNLNTLGRFMTIPKGARMKNIDLETIRREFAGRGYEIIGLEESK